MKSDKPIIVSMGEPSGISSEIIIKVWLKRDLYKIPPFVIVDDLLATGGTAKCVSRLLEENKKKVMGLLVVIELNELGGRTQFDFPVNSLIKY